MAEHGGELAGEEPMKLASGFRIESNYRACTILYRFPSDSPRKPTPTELSWIDHFYNSTPSFKKRDEFDASVPTPARAKKFAQRREDDAYF